MTQLANAATWRPRTNASLVGRLAKAVAIGVAVLILSQYVAGYMFLWSIGSRPLAATPLTIVRYAYYYGDRIDVGMRLKVASVASVTLILLVALPALLQRQR